MTSSTQVFTRTAKGDLEVTGNRRLSAGLINVLSLVDGESSVAEVSARSGLSRAVLETALEILLEDGMVKLGLQKTHAAAPSPTSPDQQRQSASKPPSRNDPKPQDENLAPPTDFLGSMMREVQHDLGLDQHGGSVPSAPPAVSRAELSKSTTTAISEPGKNTLIERAQRKIAEAQVKAQTPEQEAARHKAEMGAKVGAERYAKLKANAESKTKSRETEFLAADARTKGMAVAKAKAEAEAKEEERKRLALEEEARAQAAAVDAKLTAEAEVRAREAEARRRAEEESSLKAAADAKAKAEAEAETREQEARLKAQAEARAQAEQQARLKANAEARAKDDELKRLAGEAESRARAAAEEARQKAQAAARAREEEARLEAETKAEAEAEYQARLKAEAAHQARLEAEAEHDARLKAEAEAKEGELKRLNLEAEAREQAAAAEVLLKAEAQAEAKAREEEARRRAEEDARLKAEAEAKAKAEAEANAKEEELKRLALEAEARAQVAAAEAKLKAEAEAKTREEEAYRHAEEEAGSKAQAEAEYQARMKAEEESHAAGELIAQEEARIEQAVEARARARTAEPPPVYDHFGLPDLPMAPEEIGARSALHPAESPAALSEPQMDRPAQIPGPAEQESYPDQDIEDDDVPTPAHKREDERSSGFSPAQRKPKAIDSPNKYVALATVRVRRSGAAIPWGKIVAVSLVLMVVAALGALHLVSQTQLRQEAERILTETLGKPVSMTTATVELFPSPLVRFKSVKIGEPAMVRISEIKAIPDTRAWLNGTKAFKTAELGSVSFRPESYESIFELLLAARTRLKLPVRRIDIPSIEVPPNGLGVKNVAAQLELVPGGGLRKVVFTSKTGQMTVDLDPQDSHFELTLSAQSWRLPGTDVDMESLHAAGQLKKNEFIIADVNGRVYGGRIDGKGSLRWSDRWRLNGTFKANGIEIDRLPAVPVVSQGMLGLNGRFEAAADDSASLISRLKVGGKFSVQDGKLSGIDIARVLAERPKDVFGGMTPFKTLDGVFQTSTKGHELRDIRLTGGSLSASGHASLSSNKELSGRMAATLNISRRRMQETLYLSGPATAPQFRVEK